MDQAGAAHDAFGVVEIPIDRVIAGKGDIGVLDDAARAGDVFGAEHVGQAEVGTPLAEFITQRGLIRGNHAAATIDIGADRRVLRIRKAGGVGENDQLEAVEVFLGQHLVREQLEGQPGFDEGVIETEIVLLGGMPLFRRQWRSVVEDR